MAARRRPPPKPALALDPDARLLRIAERLVAADKARDALLEFARYTSPDPDDMDDATRSTYFPARPHRAIAHALHEVEARRVKRLIINCPPRHGKTQLASKRFIPWYVGRNPSHSVIFGTYNEKYSRDIGRAVREVMVSPQYLQVFPDVDVRNTMATVDKIVLPFGDAQLSFAGRGGSITGRGGHLLVIDDPLKDRKEADSPTIRDTLWDWYQDTMKSRMMTDDSVVVLIQTRWHADDLVGRLIDPTNDHYDPDTAAQWSIIDLPALAEEDDPLGRKPGEPLWPERFSRAFLEETRKANPRGFASLYQGRPVARGGNLFQEAWLRPYQKHQLPADLRIYAASDHAVSTDQDRDKSVILLAGVDSEDNIWILPELYWQRADTGVVVERMVATIKKHKPVFWWAEKSHITKSIGPFLRKRMVEESAYASIIELGTTADKQTRAQAIAGRMSMGKVRFPAFAPWWIQARAEMMAFPSGVHDDFVDALAYLGMGLATLRPAQVVKKDTGPQPGTFGHMMQQARREDARRRLARVAGGF